MAYTIICSIKYAIHRFTLIWLLENFTVLEWPGYISIRCVQITVRV